MADMNKLIKDRHKAFAGVLYDKDFKQLKKYCKKYDVTMPDDAWVMEVAALKGICHCTDFSEEEKKTARLRLWLLGSTPELR